MTRGVSKHAVAHYEAVRGPSVVLVLTYRRDQPWEITARFLTAENEGRGVAWVFARDLLALGLHGPAGEGDVHVRPAAPLHVAIGLDNGTDAPCAFYVPAHALGVFLDATAHLVPFGTESAHTDLDALCDALTRKAA